jgi:hypothetical protein
LKIFFDTFPYRGSLVKPNLVPYDKFRPENKVRLYKYISFIIQVCPHQIKFGDEKSLKGQDLFLRHVRRNPLTGIIPLVITNPDWRNTHSITGFCGMDRRMRVLWYCI